MDKPTCVLVGQDGNVFNVIGLVAKALKEAGLSDKAKEFTKKVFECGDYDEVLRLAMDYVEVE